MTETSNQLACKTCEFLTFLSNFQLSEVTAILLGSVIGGLLAAGAGVMLDSFRENRQQKRGRNLLVTAICDDLDHSLKVYDSIQTTWLEFKFVQFSLLNELKESRQPYHNNKDWVVIFEDPELRRDVFRYYLQSSQSINSLEYNQNRKYAIDERYNETRSKIELEHPQLSNEEIKKKTLESMPKEVSEYTQIDRLISEQLSKLFLYKKTAQKLSEQFKSQIDS